LEKSFGLFLVGRNGKKQGMEDSVFKIILELADLERRSEYSESNAMALAKALREAVTRPPYNGTTTRSSLLGVARFFQSCRGFTVEEWKPQLHRGPSKSEPRMDSRRKAIVETVRRRLDELERGDGNQD
jgi:hypothetical protein